MKLLLVAYLCAFGVCAIAGTPDADPANHANSSPFPPQLEVRAPLAPTAFPSGNRSYLVYELHLTNFSGNPMTVLRIDVLDAQQPGARSIASFSGEQLGRILLPIGATASNGDEVGAGATVIAFMWVPIDRELRAHVRLLHRVSTSAGVVEGGVVEATHFKLPVLSPPVRGANWLISDGPSNDPSNHHRRGLLIIDGKATISRRFAIDWMIQRGNDVSSGDPRDLRSYYSYRQPVFAVADATVEQARDGIPDNTPGPLENFHRAVPITMDTIGGNTIVLNLGDGQYAWYFHLAPGSIQVKAGERVRRGQQMASIGCSGDPNIPHLHFELTNSPKLLAGEGLPYVIDHYGVRNIDAWDRHFGELPLDGMILDVGESGGQRNQ